MEWKLFAINLLIGIVAGIIANGLSPFVFSKRVQLPAVSRVSSLWSMVIVLYVFAALYLVEERWLIPLEYRVLVVLLVFLLILLLAYLLKLMGRRPWQELLVTCIIPAVVIYVVNPLFPRGIYLECPRLVADDTVVKGLVAREEWNINLLVYPLKSAEWWVQQVPISDRTGRWQARAVLGGTSGDQFEVLAIATPQGILYREGEVIQPDQIPRSAFKSKIYLVEKR